ncbi:EIN3-binding F-box protein 1 [Platysternon megacephalum]|uniref:EIN3-binding F-box protein 1 n=1 Tax=Platysternon megacephalum TaxID=55544 RepID=A0A4D9DFI4_9SAUR|nr:EIN3-binding F-box protein 1 [Platysternon megacephalum]
MHNLRQPPEMMDQPAEKLVVFPSDDIVLRCEATGTPPLEFRWTKDGRLFDPRREAGVTVVEGSGTLYVNNSNAGRYQGVYRCYASNDLGTAMGPEIRVITETNSVKFRQPRLMVPPGETSSHVALRGSSLALECIAEGFPTPTVQWIRLNGPLPAERTALENSQRTLRIRDVVEEDDGDNHHPGDRPPATSPSNRPLATSNHTPSNHRPGDSPPATSPSNRCLATINHPPSNRPPATAPPATSPGYSLLATINHPLTSHTLATTAPGNCHPWQPAQAWQLGPSNQPLATVPSLAPPPPRAHPARHPLGWWVWGCRGGDGSSAPPLPPPPAELPTKILTPDEQRYAVVENQTASLDCQTFGAPVPNVEWYSIEPGLLRIADVDYADQGVYTCRARTALDAAEESAELRVVGRPGPVSELQVSEHQERRVKLSWIPGDDHNSPIEKFVVEAEDGLRDPGTWRDVSTVRGQQPWARLPLAPYGHFRFRVRAANRFGRGEPSAASAPVHTSAAAPERYPEGVAGEGNETDNMLITWKPLNKSDWNAPELSYRVQWRRLGEGGSWSEETVGGPPLLVTKTPTFVPYEIKVQSVNPVGKGPEPPTVVGYSGEDVPQVNPENVGVEIFNSTSVLVSWTLPDRDQLRGHLRGFRVFYWRLGSVGGPSRRPARAQPPPLVLTVEGEVPRARLGGLRPWSWYCLYVVVFNGRSDGPRSEDIDFSTPEGGETPLHPQPPIRAGWALTPPCPPVNGSELGPLHEISFPVSQLNGTLARLDPRGRYRFQLRALTRASQGEPLVQEGSTVPEPVLPTLENISISLVGPDFALVTWVPSRQRSVDFEIQFMSKTAVESWRTSGQANSSHGSYRLLGLQPGNSYRIQFVGRDPSGGSVCFWESEMQTNGKLLTTDQRTFATEGWFIGFICAVVLLLLLLLILCFVKRSKGGKYSVKDKEDTQVDSEARPMKDETFGEYSDNEEKPFGSSQPSLNGALPALGSEDSLADYGGSVDVQFNEDGSFIGQYSGHTGKEPAGNDSSGATSPTNANAALE